MRRIVILLATMAICGWAGPGWADHGWYQGGPPPVAADQGYGASGHVGGCGSYANGWGCGACNGCGGWGDGCGGCRHRLAAKKAEAGYFNCRCRGSYKFPVPPQYTYHWPGMYSQQTMTEYNSPYRFPPLNPPDEVFGREDEPPDTDEIAGPPARPTRASSAEPKKLPNSDGSGRTRQVLGTTSQRMKRLYGVP